MREKKEEYWPLLDDGYGGTPSGADGGADGDPLRVLLFVLAAATLAVLALSLAGCSRTAYVPVESASRVRDSVNIIDSTVVRYETRMQDSIRIKDSTVIVQDAAGNIVMKEHYRETERYRSLADAYGELLRRYESLRAERRDSVAVPFPVERRLTWWEKTQIYGFWVALAAILVCLFIANRKRIISRLTRRSV